MELQKLWSQVAPYRSMLLERPGEVGCLSRGAAVTFSHQPLSERSSASGEKGSAPGEVPDLSPSPNPRERKSSDPYGRI